MKIIREQPGKVVNVSNIQPVPTAAIGQRNYGLRHISHEDRNKLLHSGTLSKQGENWVRKNDV